MAVKITVYGEAKLQQIRAAQNQLRDLERAAKGASGGFAQSMSKVGGAATGASGKMRGLSRVMKRDVNPTLAMVGGAGVAAAAAGLFRFGQKAVGAFENLGTESIKLQRYMGGSIEDASRLGHALRMSGLDSETTAKGIGIFQKNIVTASGQIQKFTAEQTAAQKAGKPFHKSLSGNAQAISSMGIKLRDATGKLRPSKDLLLDVADKFSKMPNGAGKTALALKLFGRSGMTMVPFLNKGKKGISDLMTESDKLGTTLTGKDADAVKQSIQNKRKLSESFKGLQVSVGKDLLPIVQKFVGFLTERVVPAVKTVVGWMDKHRAIVATVAAVIVPLVAGVLLFVKAMQIYTAVTEAVTVAQAALNGTILANPMFWIVVAIVAVVAALTLFFTKTELGRKIIKKAWDGIKAAIHAVVEWFKVTAWPTIKRVWDFIVGYVRFVWRIYATVIRAVIGVVAGLVRWFMGSLWPGIKRVWDLVVAYVRFVFRVYARVIGAIIGVVRRIVNFFTGTLWPGIKRVWDNISGGVTTVKDRITTGFGRIVDFVKGLPGKIASAASGLWDGLKSGLVGAVNWIIDKVNGMIAGVNKLIDGVNSVNPLKNIPRIPDIPHLAQGGIVTRPTVALIGEAGPEAVVPLRRTAAMSPSVTIQPGAVVLNIGGDMTLGDQNRLAAIVEASLEQSMRRLARELRAR